MSLHLNKYVLINLIILLTSLNAFSASYHIVEKGETLYSISKKYNLTVDELTRLNNINDGVIKTGQKLTVSKDSDSTPPSVSKDTGEYQVMKGDTWYGIARKYSISVNDLYALNGADSKTALKAGEKIKIPSGKAVAAVTDVKDSTKNNTVEQPLPDLKVTDPHKYSSKKGDANLIWPVKTTDVSYVKGKVSGVILTAQKNDSVTAIMAGTVMFSGSYRGFGNVVFIQSKTGHIYAYTGLDVISVSKGEYVDTGARIGTVGRDAYTDKYQVQLMVFQNGQPIDPAKAPRG